MPQTYGPCSGWDPIYCAVWPTGSEQVTGYAIQAAQEILYAESGQQFGLCERPLRPCRRSCFSGWGGGWWEWSAGIPWGSWPQPFNYRGQWFNLTCGGGCGGSCSCVALEEAWLPGPVYGITQVKLNGEIMASGSYRVDNDQLLVRTDGGAWPVCQNMAANDDQPDTWSVTAQFGIPVPIAGRQAVGELANEIAKACLGIECRLPPNIATLARQGVTIQFGDPNDFVERLYFCGLFIKAVNPNRYEATARIFDPDGDQFRRTNTTAY